MVTVELYLVLRIPVEMDAFVLFNGLAVECVNQLPNNLANRPVDFLFKLTSSISEND